MPEPNQNQGWDWTNWWSENRWPWEPPKQPRATSPGIADWLFNRQAIEQMYSDQDIRSDRTKYIMQTPQYTEQDYLRRLGGIPIGQGADSGTQEQTDRDKVVQELQDAEAERARLENELLKQQVAQGARKFTREEAESQLSLMGNPPGYIVLPDEDGNWYVGRDPFYEAPPTLFKQNLVPNPYDNPDTSQVEGQFNPYTGQWVAPQGYVSPAEQRRTDLESQQRQQEQDNWMRQFELQQMQFDFQRQQAEAAAAQAQQNYLANLRANPASWLEYAGASGEQAAVQPWMVPISNGSLQAGQALPGVSSSGELNAQGLPNLTTPSAQYISRITPSARAQYAGYKQAQTGQTALDTDYWLRAGSPPGGSFAGASRTRF